MMVVYGEALLAADTSIIQLHNMVSFIPQSVGWEMETAYKLQIVLKWTATIELSSITRITEHPLMCDIYCPIQNI